MSLSVAIATHNEEKNILRTLESVYDWVDEIVVVDGESTDGTIALIKKQDTRNLPAGRQGKIQIFHETNPPMFHINKQKAIERCRGDWILQLDADEVVTEELKNEIQNTIVPLSHGSMAGKTMKQSSNETMTQPVVVYWLPRLNYFLGRPLRKGGQYPDYTIRLYKNGVARFPCRDVHENVEIKINNEFQRISMNFNEFPQVGFLESNLLHFPYPTFADYLDKWHRYSLLEAQNLQKQGVKPSVTLATCYLLLYPAQWFLKTYFRHLGILDGIPGLVFSFFSAIRFWKIYSELHDLSSQS